ncbi:hypothetical protein [Verrucomicrobium spinosum]|uniref:hypothetical protein n=1 Tax=Verrucomicrobium spinosum TaxID=2736 RepID=UPI0012E255A6|nr:hypothetical protein [Verrucomicrobium spinosum]
MLHRVPLRSRQLEPHHEEAHRLGFTDDVTSPVIAMGLADDPGEFHGVLGISAKQASPSGSSAELGQHSSSPKDIGQDTDSAQKLLWLDFGFLALYTLALLLLIWHLTTAKILQPRPLPSFWPVCRSSSPLQTWWRISAPFPCSAG